MTSTRVKRERRGPIKLAYIEHVGPYDKIPFSEYLGRLYEWAKENHVRPGFYPLGMFQDSPDTTPQENLRSEIGIQVYGEARASNGILIKELPDMDVASISHKGPSGDYPQTYKELSDWITNHGYEWTGPSMELYTRKPKLVRGETILFTKIMAPLRKATISRDRREN